MAFIDLEIIHRFEERLLNTLEFEPATVDVLEANLFAVCFPYLSMFDVLI
jgi:hypothetical protein